MENMVMVIVTSLIAKKEQRERKEVMSKVLNNMLQNMLRNKVIPLILLVTLERKMVNNNRLKDLFNIIVLVM
jgi:hypothetical protein